MEDEEYVSDIYMCVICIREINREQVNMYTSVICIERKRGIYGVASVSRIDKILGLF